MRSDAFDDCVKRAPFNVGCVRECEAADCVTREGHWGSDSKLWVALFQRADGDRREIPCIGKQRRPSGVRVQPGVDQEKEQKKHDTDPDLQESRLCVAPEHDDILSKQDAHLEGERCGGRHHGGRIGANGAPATAIDSLSASSLPLPLSSRREP